jgi:hypothetical protein
VAEEKRPLLAILLGSGGIGGLIVGVVALADFLDGSNPTPGPPAPERTPDFIPTVPAFTQPPPVETGAPAPFSLAPDLETQAPQAAIDFTISGQFTQAQGLILEQAAIRIDGMDAGLIEVHAAEPFKSLELRAAPGRHFYEVTVVATYDQGLGPTSYQYYGTGEIDVTPNARFEVRYDPFGSAGLIRQP